MTTQKHFDTCEGEGRGCTLDEENCPAVICDSNSWGIGAVLEGYDGVCNEVTRIEITAIGREEILGVNLRSDFESLWDLNEGCWREVKP